MIRHRLRRRRLLAAAASGAALGLPALVHARQPAAGPTGTVISHGIAIHGMPGYPADATHLSYVNPNAPKGGTLRLAARGTFDSFNPFILRGVPAAGITQLWDSLLEGVGDEASTEYGLLAETIEYPENRAWTAFTLRSQARWHDGKPITAEDVIFTFETLKEKGRPFYAAYYGDVVKVEATAPNKVLFTFKHANNRELPVIIGQLPVLPKHYWAERPFDRTTLEVPVGSGPFKVDSFEPGRWIQYRRDPNYWGKDLWINVGRENFEVTRYDYYRDVGVIFEAFKAGEVDLRQENIARNWATGYDFPAVRNGQVKREEIKHELPTGMQCFAYNLRRPMFADRRVREAIAQMFDFEWSNKSLFYGLYKRNISFFGNSELASTGLPSPEELKLLEPLRAKIPPEVFTKTFAPPVTDASGSNREGARRAIALLKEAGWEVKGGKMVEAKSGQPMAFEFLLNDASFERIVLPFKQSLERIGVEMRVRTVDTAQYQQRTDDFDFDITSEGFGQSLSPGNEQRDFWGSAAANAKGSRNTCGISDPAIDALIEHVIQAPDRPELITACHALDRVLLWNQFVIPSWHSATAYVAYWNKFSRPEKTAKYRPVALDTWWVDQTKERTLERPGGKG
jgi:microcin C transport system substrate-binding protein